MFRDVVPITELPDQLDDENALAWQVDLGPYVEADKIGLDVGRTRRTLRAAGFGALVVKDYFGEQSEFDMSGASVSGMNADGSAVGTGSATSRKSETEKTHVRSAGDSQLDKAFRWPTAEIAVNRTEVASRISDRVRKGRTREQAWTTELDHSVRQGLRRAALAKYKGDFTENQFESFLSMLNASLLAYDAVTANVGGVGVMTAIYGVSAGVGLLHNKLNTGETQLQRLRLSMFSYGVQADRMALGGMLAAGQRLVRPTKPGDFSEEILHEAEYS